MLVCKVQFHPRESYENFTSKNLTVRKNLTEVCDISVKSLQKQPLPLVETELRTTTVSTTDLKDRYRPVGYENENSLRKC